MFSCEYCETHSKNSITFLYNTFSGFFCIMLVAGVKLIAKTQILLVSKLLYSVNNFSPKMRWEQNDDFFLKWVLCIRSCKWKALKTLAWLMTNSSAKRNMLKIRSCAKVLKHIKSSCRIIITMIVNCSWYVSKFQSIKRYTKSDLKISLDVCVYVKTISWKFHFLNPRKSRVICLWSL